MPLTLSLRNAAALDNGSPPAIVLDRRGATIGRAPTSDWCLPDPTLHISSRHCEIRFADGRYELIDRSTNGTFMAGDSARLAGPRVLNSGDVFVVGPFEIVAALDEASAAAAQARTPVETTPEWRGWTAAADRGASAAPATPGSWDQRPVGSAISGTGPLSQSWAPPRAAGTEAAGGWGPPPTSPSPPGPEWGAAPGATQESPASEWRAPAPSTTPSGEWGAPEGSVWGTPAPEALPGASDWSSPPAARPAGHPDDVWGKFAASNLVDWARGGFGANGEAAPPAFAAASGPAPVPASHSAAAPQGPPPPAAPPSQPAPAPQQTPAGSALAHLAGSAGIPPERLQMGEGATVSIAGALLRRLVSGLVVMLEARTRAKNQLGAQTTSLEFDGNNPLKFARTPEQALVQLLNAPERGFMEGERAVEDAFRDLQAHQMATLSAMQGALRVTLERFSPGAIRGRTPAGGFLTSVFPWAKSARLWDAYEREFSGVARGSDEAFMDVFAREFRNAYEEMSRRR